MKYRFTILSAALLVLLCGNASAQGKSAARKAKVVEVTSQVVDVQGRPIEGAVITAGEGAITRYTDAEGRFTIASKADAVILIEALGYEDMVLNLRVNPDPKSITLTAEEYLSGEKYMIERPDGASVSQHDLTAAIGKVDVEKIKSYPDLNLSNAFQGRAAGLIVRSNSHGLGNNTSSIYVRGLHAAGSNAIVVVDGIERSIEDIAPEEIGSIEVLKDAAAKVLYGARATNGVLLINTKRGEANKRIIRTSVEYGVQANSRVPKFLGASEYVRFYNEARVNDGLAPYYTDDEIAGYDNSTGENDLLFPNVDWYRRFTGDMNMFRKAVAEFNGGNESVKYSVVTSYTGGTGHEKVERKTGLDRFNVRGNLDIRINDFLTATADVAARIELRNTGAVNCGTLYQSLSTLKPNEYPFTISAEALGLEPNEDGSPYYGASIAHTNNLYLDCIFGGFNKERYVNTQTNLGLKFDFDKYVKGLFADAFITFDNYSFTNEKLSKTLATYAVDGYVDTDGNYVYRSQMVKKQNLSDTINVDSESTTRTLGFRLDGGYRRSFGLNDFSIVAAYRYYNEEILGANQDLLVTNGTLRLNWGYDDRFFVEAIAGMAGSNQFSKAHRYAFTPVVSAAWVLSNEDFLKGSPAVNFLKVKASAGRLAVNTNSAYLLYNTAWSNGGTYPTGATNNSSEYYTSLNRIASPNVGWVMSNEANLGIEGIFLGGRLSAQADVFAESRIGQISQMGTQYSALVGDYLTNKNNGRVDNKGVEFDIHWNDSALGGDLRYKAGLNFTFTRNKVVSANELVNMEEYRKTVGKPTSAIISLQDEGLFTSEAQVASHATQNFGYYGLGDIAYKDLNTDGLIDDRDQKMIGQSFPLTTWGLDFDINYKGFGLYVLATAETGASKFLTNSYYWNTEANNYSVLARDSYHPTRNPEGIYPRLSSTGGTNSYRESSFWLEDASFLRLKNVELSYTLDNRRPDGFFKQAKFFVRGTNLFVISRIKDLDPEMLDAGITNYPAYKTLTGGLNISF